MTKLKLAKLFMNYSLFAFCYYFLQPQYTSYMPFSTQITHYITLYISLLSLAHFLIYPGFSKGKKNLNLLQSVALFLKHLARPASSSLSAMKMIYRFLCSYIRSLQSSVLPHYLFRSISSLANRL